MLCPAAVSAAAAAAVWLLAVLGPVLSLPAEHNSEADFSLCSHCFYRQTPPQGASAGPPLYPLCHRLPAGQTFATLSKPTCDTAVYSAFHLSCRGEEGGGEEEQGEPVDEDDITRAAVPALLRGDGHPSDPLAPTDSLQHWDTTIATLVRSSLTPQCSALEGDLYILTGAGGLKVAEDGGEECHTQPLWSAVCCAASEGKSSFSVGLIKETEEGERQVSVKELEEILGVSELFSEGCGRADGEAIGIIAGLFGQGVPETVEEVNADLTDENTEAEDVESNTDGQSTEEDEVALDAINYDSNTEENSEAPTAEEEEAASRVLNEDVQNFRDAGTSQEEEDGSDTGSQASSEDVEENKEAQTAEEYVAAVDAQREEADAADATQETSPGSDTSERSSSEQRDVRYTRSDGSESSAGDETVDEQQTDTNSSSTLVYILSTTLYIMKAPLQPVFSTLTQLPGQVLYVLQEDLGVLSALPGDTFSVFHLLTSDILSGLGSAADMVYGIGETCFSNIYCCTSSMLGALYTSCHTGVTGVGTLAGDTVGVFNGILDRTWWVTKFFGGRLWEQSEGYVGTVVSEMGGQVQAVGGGVGRLAWNSGNGVGNTFRYGWRFIRGFMGMIIGAARGAFGEESE